MREELAPPDVRVAEIASRQFGVVSLAQLLAAGLSTSAISRRVVRGRLHRIHRGVYAVGHRSLPLYGRLMAAVFACGPTAIISHRSAAVLWGMLEQHRGAVDVTVARRTGRAKRRGVNLHRRVRLDASAVTRRLGIPVTTPTRTVADLRGAVSAWELRRAIRQANVLGLPLEEADRRERTRSDLERDFLRICRRHRLPDPEVNVKVGSYLVDFLWRDRALAVETDGYRFHRGRQAFRDDRARDLELRARGLEVIRLSEEQIEEEPERVAEILREVLASRPHRVGADGG